MQANIGDYILTKSLARKVIDIEDWPGGRYIFENGQALNCDALMTYEDRYAILSTDGSLRYKDDDTLLPPKWVDDWVNRLKDKITGEKLMNCGAKEQAKVYEKQILVFGNNIKKCSVDELKNLLKKINIELSQLEDIYDDVPEFVDREASKLEKAKEAVCEELNKR